MVRAAFVFMVLLLAGCDDGNRADSRTLDVEDEDFRQGQNFYKQGEVRKALECYLKVIDKRKGAAESNLEAGRMYLELQDPLPAIYHFNQYIRMKPTSEQSNLVRQLIKTAEKQFMQQLPGRPMDPDVLGGSDLNAKLRSLQNENEKLKRELADYNRTQKGLVLPAKTTTEKTADKPATAEEGKPARFRQYTIAKGDTLNSISKKTYGDTAHVSAIFNANRDKMTSVNSLPKIGTVILLPE
ncbi:MAG: LysM peptidoglycan-binding domain-containing protein [Opitutales bacterium]|jgi:LysM repeat protein|nr:LysM peptidoglycan-binding domain-containing protein [Opitutales bacterium]